MCTQGGLLAAVHLIFMRKVQCRVSTTSLNSLEEALVLIDTVSGCTLLGTARHKACC